MPENPEPPAPAAVRPTFWEAARYWFRLGCISFGGPAGQIAIMHTDLVDRKRWISEERFLHALNFCMLLPGPEAQQLATYIGWRLHGTAGGVVAGALFVLPAAILLWALSWLYAAAGSVPAIAAIFYGLQPAVIAIVAAAVLRIGRTALRNRAMWAVAAAAFVALFVFKISFLAVIATAAMIGAAGARWYPRSFARPPSGEAAAPLPDREPLDHGRTVRIAVTCLLLWWTPVALACLWPEAIFASLGMFFSKAALVTFGGAYAVLPFVAQQAVEHYHWLTASQMVAGLGLAETTPGPLILVLEFVGFLAAWQHPGTLPPLAAGTLGAMVTLWVTFVPSFLFVLTGAPYMERLRGSRVLSGALSTITAAVAGIILNLAVWFGIHVIFPGPQRVDFFALALAVVFFLGIWKGRWPVLPVVAGSAVLGLAAKLFLAIP
ncbi:chromate transporter [Spartobacteria bacterium LR76]|nr:chromate transporter [Spartobacteria bacterium LR76]